MCSVSAIGDAYTRDFSYRWPTVIDDGPSRVEFDLLKKEVQSLRNLLLKAKDFDMETGQPECEVEDKVALIKKIAALVGVDMNEVFA